MINTSKAIVLKDASVRFGDDVLFEHVSVDVERGQALVLIGPSGEGKSTLLKLMAGLLEPASGEVETSGTMGMLFQKNALFDSLTCAENVAFPLREVAKASESEIEKAITYYLDAVGILHARDLYPDEISGGMQKRLGIARALALKPEIVFYDDPTAGLDPITSRKIVQLIKDLQKKMNTTVVAVTNDMNRAAQIADHVAMIVDGELIDCGTPEQMKQHKDPRVKQFIHGALHGPLTDAAFTSESVTA